MIIMGLAVKIYLFGYVYANISVPYGKLLCLLRLFHSNVIQSSLQYGFTMAQSETFNFVFPLMCHNYYKCIRLL